MWLLQIIKKRKLGNIYDLVNLFLETYNYDKRDKREFADPSDMPPLEDDEEVKKGKGLKNLTPNKLLPKLPMLLAEIKAEINSDKLKKKEIRQILYLLHQHNKITKKCYTNLIKLLK